MLEEIKSRIINTGRDTRYSIQAYEFFVLTKNILERVFNETNAAYRDFSAKKIVKSTVKTATALYGPTAEYVLANMGILSAKDIGAIAFNLIDLGFWERNSILGKYEDFVAISQKPLFWKVKPKPLNMKNLKIFEDT